MTSGTLLSAGDEFGFNLNDGSREPALRGLRKEGDITAEAPCKEEARQDSQDPRLRPRRFQGRIYFPAFGEPNQVRRHAGWRRNLSAPNPWRHLSDLEIDARERSTGGQAWNHYASSGGSRRP